MNDRIEFLGLDFDRWDAARVRGWLGERDADSPYAYVVTPNVDHIVRLTKADDDVRRAYADADLCLCDSRVLARLGRAVGVDLSIVPGSDLTEWLFSDILGAGDTICLVGGKSGDDAALESLHPGVTIVQHVPPMGLRGNAAARAATVEKALATPARVILLAVGSPQQELLAHAIAAHPLARGTALCIGASVDFLLGTQRRAPVVVQRLSLEWAWRLLSDPRRLARRYLVEGPAIFPLIWRWRRDRRR